MLSYNENIPDAQQIAQRYVERRVYMLNANKLKGKIVEEGTTQEELASKIGMTLQSLNAKLNGRSTFDINEAFKIIEILHIDNPSEIFFAPSVPNTQR